MRKKLTSFHITIISIYQDLNLSDFYHGYIIHNSSPFLKESCIMHPVQKTFNGQIHWRIIIKQTNLVSNVGKIFDHA